MTGETSEAAPENYSVVLGLSRWVNWLTGAVVACSMLTLLARYWWIADMLANLRVQLLLGLVGTLVLLLVMRKWRLVMIVTAVFLWQASALQSAFLSSGQTPAQSDAAASTINEPSLRVFLANVLTGNQDHEAIIAQIRGAEPDLIVILELNSGLEESLNQHFGVTHKYVMSEPQDRGNFGIGLWSRYPMSNDLLFHLNTPALPSIEADIQLPSQTIHVVATHPLPPMGAWNFDHRNRHLELLGERIRKQFQVEPTMSLILLGDLNLTPWSPLFDDFQAATGLQNSAAGQGLEPTWYWQNAFAFGLVLDHGLHSKNLHCKKRTIVPRNGSDHRALVLDF